MNTLFYQFNQTFCFINEDKFVSVFLSLCHKISKRAYT